jgi:hypothetical protein
MFAALHGELELHPWRDTLVAPPDAYSLFVARSSAMGWLTEAVQHTSGGFWGMNDAGQNPHSGSRPSRIAWFQVSLTDPVRAGRPLPVEAFLSCAGDVVARIGTMRLQAVQVLMPVQILGEPEGTSSRMNSAMVLLQEAGWFAGCDPHMKTQVQVAVDSGQDPSIPSAAPGMLRWMQELKQSVFLCDSLSLTDNEDMVLGPAVIDELWLGPAHHRATFRGTLAEWSLDAVGWLASFLAEASFQHGVSTPLMFTASRTEEPSPKVLHRQHQDMNVS